MLSVPHYRDGFSYWHYLSSPSSHLEYSCGKSIRLPTSIRRRLWKRNNVLQRIRSPISYWYSIGISDSFTWFLFNKKISLEGPSDQLKTLLEFLKKHQDKFQKDADVFTHSSWRIFILSRGICFVLIAEFSKPEKSDQRIRNPFWQSIV